MQILRLATYSYRKPYIDLSRGDATARNTITLEYISLGCVIARYCRATTLFLMKREISQTVGHALAISYSETHCAFLSLFDCIDERYIRASRRFTLRCETYPAYDDDLR